MYSPNNNTDENIQEYYKNKQKNNYLNNSFQNADSSLSLMPYNSMPLSQYQIGGYQLSNNFNPQYESKNQNYNNNLSTNEIIETSNEQNINNEIEHNAENKINNNENKKKEETKEEIIDPAEEIFEKNEKKEKTDEGNEEVLSALSEESNNEKEYNNHLLAQYETVKRIKTKWKVNLKGCIAQKDNMEYVCGKIHGELERDW